MIGKILSLLCVAVVGTTNAAADFIIREPKFDIPEIPGFDMKNLFGTIADQMLTMTFGQKYTCEQCTSVETEVTEVLGALFVGWKPILGEICKIIAEKSTLTDVGCNTILGRYVPIFEQSYVKLMVQNHGVICGFTLQVCQNSSISRVEVGPIIDQIYQGMPPVKPYNPTYRQTYQILQVNDIHIDFEYLSGGIVNCKEGIMCCRANKTVLPGQNPVYAGYWGSLGGNCDLPEHTFDQFISFVKTQIKPDYVFWLGDNENHEVDMITKDTNIQTTKILSQKLSQLLPTSKLFLAIGNHENNPVDNMDFNNIIANQWFFNNLTSDYTPLLTKDELAQIKSKGYYSTYVKERNLRIISLFSAPMDSINFYLLVRTYDADGQFSWLWNQLKTAEQNNESVFIIIHIPIGNDYSIALWDELFNAVTERYQNNIKAVFSAHTHNDHLIFHRSRYDNQTVVKTQYVGPSLTTFSNLNPSFRVFKVDADTNEIIDYTQYRLDLTKYNQLGPDVNLEWDVAYTFKQEYGVPDMSPASMQTLWDKFSADYTTMGLYIANFYTMAYTGEAVDPKKAIYTRCQMYANSGEMLKCFGLLLPAVAQGMTATLISGNLFPAFMKFGK